MKQITDQEFYNRLEVKLEEEHKGTLINMLLEYAHEEVSEFYNNEILSDWEAEQED